MRLKLKTQSYESSCIFPTQCLVKASTESFKALKAEEQERAYPLNICITSLNFQTIINDKL
jgi:hypothetical protein